MPKIGCESGALRWGTVKKMVESAFSDTSMTVAVYTQNPTRSKATRMPIPRPTTPDPGKGTADTWSSVARRGPKVRDRAPTGTTQVNRARSTDGGVRANRSRSSRQGDAILIKKTGGSYADLLKKVRGSVNLDEAGVKVKGIRQTRTGDLLIEVGRGKGEAAKIKAAVEVKLPGLGGVRELSRKGTLVIRDLDAATNQDEVAAAIERDTGAPPATIAVRSIRQAFASTQVAIVEVPLDAAEKLAHQGSIKVGWLERCRVRWWTRGRDTNCFRCLGHGHLAADCTEVDRSSLCFRCGQEGHKSRGCENPPHCIHCGVDGHVFRANACPKKQNAPEDGPTASLSWS